jgi:hypothetical protein
MANWRGSWDSGTAYAIDDSVTYSGTFWLCVTAVTGQAPGASADWVPEDTYTGVLGAGGTAVFAPALLPVQI